MDSAAVEKTAQAHCEKKIPPQAMLESDQPERTRFCEPEREKQASEKRKKNCNPVGVNDMDQAEAESAGNCHQPPIRKQSPVSVHEKSSVNQFL